MDTLVTQTSKPGFAGFFEATWPELVAYVHTLVRDGILAEELAQEAFTRVYVRFPLLREPRPYVYKVATNLVRSHWRSHERLVDGAEAAVDAHDASTLDAVRRLPPRLREVVLLHYYADLPVADVARQLRRPVGTVKSRLHEARAALRLSLEEPS